MLVITSYSIHYTKLYERFRGFAQPRRVLDGFDRKILIVRDPRDNVISRLMWIVATRIGSADPQDAAAVITSYSIHYTKLYDRRPPVLHHR